jgi:hypothetical protein
MALKPEKRIAIDDKHKVYTGVAYLVEKVAPILAVAYELKIVEGIVISKTEVSRAADLPATAVSLLDKKLWEQFRGA